MRGGTSAVAGILRIMGIPMGSKIEDGSHEDMPIRRALQRGDTEDFYRLVGEYGDRWPVWGFKYPRAVTIEWVLPALRNPTPIVVERPIEEVGRSAMGWGIVRSDHAEQRAETWLPYLEAAPGLRVAYADVLDDTETVVQRIADYLDSPTPDMEAVRRFIRPGEYRNLQGEPVSPSDYLTRRR